MKEQLTKFIRRHYVDTDFAPDGRAGAVFYETDHNAGQYRVVRLLVDRKVRGKLTGKKAKRWVVFEREPAGTYRRTGIERANPDSAAAAVIVHIHGPIDLADYPTLEE